MSCRQCAPRNGPIPSNFKYSNSGIFRPDSRRNPPFPSKVSVFTDVEAYEYEIIRLRGSPSIDIDISMSVATGHAARTRLMAHAASISHSILFSGTRGHMTVKVREIEATCGKHTSVESSKYRGLLIDIRDSFVSARARIRGLRVCKGKLSTPCPSNIVKSFEQSTPSKNQFSQPLTVRAPSAMVRGLTST